MPDYCRCRCRHNPIDWGARERTSRAIFNYLKQISAHPNLDDLLTVGNMAKKAYGEDLSNIMADFLPGPTGIQAIIEQLNPDEQEEARDFYASLSQSLDYKKLMQAYGWARGMSGKKGEYKFYNPKDFEETLQDMMQGNYFYPSTAASLINNNRHLINMVDIDLVNEFVNWANQKNQEVKSQPSFGNVLADALRKTITEQVIPEDAPPEVRKVGELLLKNAALAGEPLDSVYISQQDENEWVLGDNFERGYSFLIYRDGMWYVREPHTGDDYPIHNGFVGAKAQASSYYTHH